MAGERIERRLAAVLAADVAGYSRLMHKDEEATHTKLASLLADDVLPAIAEHRGRIVKNTGDGFLAEFPSAVEAVRAALQFQTRTKELSTGEVEDRRIVFRVGVNIGDVIVEAHDIFGDGVNIAARLESIAQPGGICISSFAYDQVRGKVAAEFVDLGEQNLKNIDRPVRTYAAKLKDGAVSAPDPWSKKPLPLPDKPSIAVLPFENMLGDPGQEYFTDGMVEDIITALSRFKSLFVIARNSTFVYKGRSVDIKLVGRELGVRYVLEGSVRKAAGRIRITGQLIDAVAGSHLWADKFDDRVDGDNIFDLQDGLVARVVGAIAPRIEQAEIERAKQKSTISLDAYDLYLRGLSSWNRWTKVDNDQALKLFYAAIDRDPEFSTPYGLAISCYIMDRSSHWSNYQDKTEIARLIHRARDIGMDDPIALCWAAHAMAMFFGENDEAISLVTRATELDTNLAIAWARAGWINAYAGDAGRAIDSVHRAIRLNPLDPRIFLAYSAMAFAHFIGRREAEAIEWAIKALQLKPDWPPALRVIAASNAVLGFYNEAQTSVAKLYALIPDERISTGLVNYLKRQQDKEHYSNALRTAGLRE
ncbi:adenylate/guanylate cyclase domain-containing protein [Bradyrhizobium sp. 177]|uniref:adenylate/guanylate cyclase domain-containing protein n=1 Tax=Bradyrhizobium sp. 177 TaxID=2782647 RepID=UPI001FF7E6BD